jgi:hypothetical protein
MIKRFIKKTNISEKYEQSQAVFEKNIVKKGIHTKKSTVNMSETNSIK